MRGQTHRLGRLVVIAGGVSLVALHVAVLFRRVADGTLLRPLVVAQWLVALGLLTAVGVLRSRGVSIFRGRPAAAFWIVVALMHGVVALPGGPGLVGVFNAVPVTEALPVGIGLLAGALAVLVWFLTAQSTTALDCLGMRRTAAEILPTLRLQRRLAARAPPV